MRVETCEHMGTTRRTRVRRAFVALVLLLGCSAMAAPAMCMVSIRDESSLAARGGIGPVLKGQAGVERAIVRAQARGETVLGREITIETSVGRTRPDLLTRTPEGNLRFIECKNGPCAALTTRQREAFPLIQSQGGIPRGGNAAAAGLEPGVPIGPTEILIERFP